jgi:hypothetical protein
MNQLWSSSRAQFVYSPEGEKKSSHEILNYHEMQEKHGNRSINNKHLMQYIG